MRTLLEGVSGDDVLKVQNFLIGKGFYKGKADGDFGPLMKAAVIKYQEDRGLGNDGKIGHWTLAQMIVEGLPIIQDGEELPLRPPFQPLVSNEERAKYFGQFAYIPDPEPGNPENIKIIDGWDEKNIISVEVPQLKKFVKHVWLHKKIKYQFLGFWADVEKAGLLDKIVSFDGMFNARFVRGSRSVLSNHSFGNACDINCDYNEMGSLPADFHEKGCIKELVPIAHTWGIYWGGHFTRKDGMHFECSVILKEGEKLELDYKNNSYKVIKA